MIRVNLKTGDHKVFGTMPPMPAQIENRPFADAMKQGYAVYIDDNGSAFTKPLGVFIHSFVSANTEQQDNGDTVALAVAYSPAWKIREILLVPTFRNPHSVAVRPVPDDDVSAFLAAVPSRGGRLQPTDLGDLLYGAAQLVANAVVEGTDAIPTTGSGMCFAQCTCYACVCYDCYTVAGVEVCSNPRACACC